jgi:Ca2+-binding RTX toxin-like protein
VPFHISVLVGQRGDDLLQSGDGDDLLIGDAGTNTIASNMDFPRVFQIYRSMETPLLYSPQATDFGIAFTSDFDLYPNPYRFVDSLTSIIGKSTLN